MGRQKKYMSGATITSIETLLQECRHDGFVMMNGVPKHGSWILSMQLRTVCHLLAGQAFSFAVNADELSATLPRINQGAAHDRPA